MAQSTHTSEEKKSFLYRPHAKGKYSSAIMAGFILLFFAGLVFCLYSNSLESPFIFDDVQKIAENAHIRITQFSAKEIVASGLKSSKTRFLPFISLAVNYYFHQYDPFGYHIVNVCIHILTGFFLYLFLSATLKISPRQTLQDHADSIAFVAALIWLIHPVQTQSVTYIIQRMNSLASMFFILSIWCYVKARVEGGRRKWLWYAGSAVVWLLSLGCKQNAVTLPFFVFLYEWFFFQGLDKKWLRRSLPFVLGIVVLLVFIALVYTDFQPLEKIKHIRDYSENQFTMAQRALTQPRVVMHYISLLIFGHPSRLNLDYDFALSYSLINPFTTLLSLAAIVGLLILGVYMAKKEPLIAFGIFWFFGNLVIESSVIPLALVFEHRLYLPSMLVFLVPVVLGHRYIKLIWLRAGLLCLAVVVLCVWTYQRNRVWESDLSMWTDVVNKAPGKARPHLNLGLALADRDRMDEAIQHYRKSLGINPNYAEAHNNLGIVLAKQEHTEEAIGHYRKALQIKADYTDAHNNLAAALSEQGHTEEAIKHYRYAQQLDPYNEKAQNNLGLEFFRQGRINEAIQYYRKALQINPLYPEAQFNWGAALVRLGRSDQAIGHFQKALQLDPGHAEAHNNLGGVLLNQGRRVEALGHITEALRLDPGLAEAHGNMGILLIQKGEIEKAISHFREALRINPDSSLAAANLKKALATQKQLDQKAAMIQQALKNNPDDPGLHFEMGNIFLARGDYNQAVAEFEKTVAIQPRSAPAQYNLALAYTAGKQYDKALVALNKVIALQPDNPNTYYNIAALHALLNNIDDSVQWLQKAVDKGYRNWDLIKTDKDLKSIRNSAGYKELVKNR
jgi:Flp pilus assembly protein TadD